MSNQSRNTRDTTSNTSAGCHFDKPFPDCRGEVGSDAPHHDAAIGGDGDEAARVGGEGEGGDHLGVCRDASQSLAAVKVKQADSEQKEGEEEGM